MEQIKKKARAKLNLGLDVIRRRPDGYHEVKMIMQTIELSDELTFTKIPQPGIFIALEKEDSNPSFIPTDESNLIYKAAKMLMDQFQIKQGIHILLKKTIPVAAGMAGGSTDAASTFVAMNELFELGLSLTQLEEMAVKIGADVPYCISGGTVLSQGIGEVLTPIENPPFCYLVIAKPDIDVSTKYVYENLHVDQIREHPDIDAMIQALEKKDLDQLSKLMGNILEKVTQTQYPIISKLKESMMQQGAKTSLMSGSGPTVFGIFDEKEKAEAAIRAMKEQGLAKQLFLTYFSNDFSGQSADRSMI